VKRLAALAAAALVLGACGGGSHEYAGYTFDPPQQVGAVTLPDLTADGEAFTMRAPADGLLLVYFGYTNCPMECPTTMADAALVIDQVATDDQPVELAMVTVDPDRDLAGLADYVTAFEPGAHALGTDDTAALRTAADAFGVTYQVRDDQVAHSTHLYAVDAAGTVVMVWTFPTEQPALAADVKALLG